LGCTRSVCNNKRDRVTTKTVRFTANNSSNTKIILNWSVLNDHQATNYEVEKSYNGTQFIRVGVVHSKGNIGGETNYSFLDNSPDNAFKSQLYYRLKWKETNKDYNYSGVIKIEMKTRKAFDFNLYPNPAGLVLNVTYQAPEKTPIEIRLINRSGQVIKVFAQSANQGLTCFSINIQQLPKGSYEVQLISKDNVVVTKQFVKE
jgi:hypothetical protein